MVQVQIHVKGIPELNQRLKTIPVKLNREVVNAINEWGNNLSKAYKNHLTNFPTYHVSGTPRAANSVNWRRMAYTGRTGYISLSKEAYFYSEARPHFVSLMKRIPRNIRMRKWVRGVIPRYKGTSIYVKPHPYIRRIFWSRFSSLQSRLRTAAKRGIRK